MNYCITDFSVAAGNEEYHASPDILVLPAGTSSQQVLAASRYCCRSAFTFHLDLVQQHHPPYRNGVVYCVQQFVPPGLQVRLTTGSEAGTLLLVPSTKFNTSPHHHVRALNS